jgi:multidrug efflux pump subunit AcrA (membrane-fusion protein)
MSDRGRRIRKGIVTLGVLVLIGAGAAGVYRLRQVQANVTLPMAPARKGDFLVIIRSRGELHASHSVQVYAPVVPQLRIAWLAPSGETIKEGDMMIKFDSSSSQQQLAQKEATLRQAQASLDQAVAQARITADQDKSDLADAQFNVEKAKLEVSKQEIVGQIQAEESKVDLAVAEQHLKMEEATVALHGASDVAKRASLTRQRDAAQNDVDLTKERIKQMEIRAPITGFLTFSTNYTQGFMDAKPFKVGDNVFAGMALAEIPDLNTLQLEGKIEETDRGRIAVDLDCKVHIDSLPELDLKAKVGSISPMAEQSNEFPRTRSFKAWASLQHPDPRLRPGMNGGIDIIINKIPNAISIPAKALFTRAGKPVVYMAHGNSYQPVQVEVLARNPDEVAVSGIPAGSMVALVDVEKKEQKR